MLLGGRSELGLEDFGDFGVEGILAFLFVLLGEGFLDEGIALLGELGDLLLKLGALGFLFFKLGFEFFSAETFEVTLELFGPKMVRGSF